MEDSGEYAEGWGVSVNPYDIRNRKSLFSHDEHRALVAENTWDRRVKRAQEKKDIRRLWRVKVVAWAIGWVWGGMIAVAITIGLFNLLVRVAFG